MRKQEEVQRQRPIAEAQAWLRRHGISDYEGARRLGIPYSVLQRALGGATPNLRTAAKLYYGSDGEIRFEDLLPPTLRRELKRRFGGVLMKRTAPLRTSSSSRKSARRVS